MSDNKTMKVEMELELPYATDGDPEDALPLSQYIVEKVIGDIRDTVREAVKDTIIAEAIT